MLDLRGFRIENWTPEWKFILEERMLKEVKEIFLTSKLSWSSAEEAFAVKIITRTIIPMDPTKTAKQQNSWKFLFSRRLLIIFLHFDGEEDGFSTSMRERERKKLWVWLWVTGVHTYRGAFCSVSHTYQLFYRIYFSLYEMVKNKLILLDPSLLNW